MFESPNDFSIHIENLASELNVSVLDAILFYCEENYLDPDDVSNLINTSLKNKLESNFINLNYLPKQSVLDI